MKSIIPNLLTLANLASGLFAILAIFDANVVLAAYLLAASLAFDFLDGLVARALKVHSELGLQLDSLADMVSFGVAPGFMLYSLFLEVSKSGEPLPVFLPYLAFLVPLFSALRLAKFNIDTRQTENFIGLPTPANTILIYSISIWALNTANPTTEAILLHPFFLSFLTIASSLLLVAEIPLLSMKVKELSWKANKSRILLIVLIVLLFALLRFRAFVFVIPLYLLVSIFFKPKTREIE
jgi:CDP-diacylglycerol--serine O-phosphatidyltransferase